MASRADPFASTYLVARQAWSTTPTIRRAPFARRRAGTYGYTFLDNTPLISVDDADDPNGPLSGGYFTALTGRGLNDPPKDPTPESCLGKGLAVMNASTSVDREAVDKLNKRAEARYHNDPRVKKLTSTWSPCMKQAGFSFAQPHDIERYFTKRLVGMHPGDRRLQPLQTEERRVYAADQACQAPFDEKLAAIRAEYGREVVATYLLDHPNDRQLAIGVTPKPRLESN